eukprot:Nk52_evm34s262 gene=Nk52_evmTU34s262
MRKEIKEMRKEIKEEMGKELKEIKKELNGTKLGLTGNEMKLGNQKSCLTPDVTREPSVEPSVESPVQPPMPVPRYTMGCHDGLVRCLTEWYKGLDGNSSIVDLERKHGPAWRKHQQNNFSRRKRFIEIIVEPIIQKLDLTWEQFGQLVEKEMIILNGADYKCNRLFKCLAENGTLKDYEQAIIKTSKEDKGEGRKKKVYDYILLLAKMGMHKAKKKRLAAAAQRKRRYEEAEQKKKRAKRDQASNVV